MSSDAHLDRIRSGVGHAVRRARKASGLSMKDLADRCGVTQPFISAVERGLSTPSISTLYRLAEVLGTEPAALLPFERRDEVTVIRSDEGDRAASSDRPNSAVGRVVFCDPDRHLEIYEYLAAPDEDLDVWYEHPGEVILHLIEGSLRLELIGRDDVVLRPGDCVVHPGLIPHRWAVEGSQPVRIFLVIVRSENVIDAGPDPTPERGHELRRSASPPQPARGPAQARGPRPLAAERIEVGSG